MASRADDSGYSVASAGDVDGDARADFEIELLNVTNPASLTAIDFAR